MESEYCNRTATGLGWDGTDQETQLDVIVCLRLIYAIFPDTIERDRI
jgi:hypothetical protein